MPELSLERLLERIAKGKAVPAVLLLGSETYLRDLCRTKLVEAYVPAEARDWGVSRFSAAEDPIERALGQAQTLPMLASQQVVFVEEVEALESLGDDAREKAVNRLAEYLADPAPFTVLVLEAAHLDQRMKLAKTVMDKALVVSLSLGERGANSGAVAAAMALQMARDLEVELEPAAAEELVELVDGELARLNTEIGKLATYAGDRKKITLADVERLVVSMKKYTVWEFAEMIASRQTQRALKFLDSLLREGEQPAQIVGAMAWMIRGLIAAQELPKHTDAGQAAGKLKMRRETAEMALRECGKIPRQQLLDGLEALYEVDSRLKSGVRDQRAVMEFLVACITGNAGAQAAAARP